jgi:hypothetical protein
MSNSIYQGVNYAKTQASPITQIDEGFYDSQMLKIIDTFVLTADLASGDVILVGGLIPQGAVLLDCQITSQALGGSCTVDVGWQASATPNLTGAFGSEAANSVGFFSALPVSTATVAKAHGAATEGMTSNWSNFYLYQLSAAVQPVIAEHAVSSSATGLKIAIEISYSANRL